MAHLSLPPEAIRSFELHQQQARRSSWASFLERKQDPFSIGMRRRGHSWL